MHQRADDVHIGIPVGDHHALRARRRAAGVVDRQEIAFADLASHERPAGLAEQLLVVQPRGASGSERDEMADIVELGPDAVHGRHIVRVHADDARAAVIDDVGEVGRGEPEIDRHEHRPDLRNGVERFELLMGVGCDVGDTVARPDAETLKRGRPSVGAPEELLVRQRSEPSTTASRPPYNRRARRANSKGVSGVSMGRRGERWFRM
jgi:hypothetical protein